MSERRTPIKGVEQQPIYELIGPIVERYLKFLGEPGKPDLDIPFRPVPPGTIDSYKNDFRAFGQFCNGHNITTIGQITQELLEEFEKWQKQKRMSGRTITRRLGNLGHLVKFVITYNPDFTTETRYALLRAVKIPFLTAEEVEDVNQTIALRLQVASKPKRPIELRNALAVRIPLSTTATVAEMAGLRFSDFKSVDQQPTVTLRRGRKNLQIPIDEDLSKAVTEFKAIRRAIEDDYLFRNGNTADGNSVPTEGGVWSIQNAYTKKAFGKPIPSQTLSNTYWTQKPSEIESIPATRQDEKPPSLELKDTRRLVLTLISRIQSAQTPENKILPAREALLIMLLLATGAEIDAIAQLRVSDFESGKNPTVTFQENGQKDRVAIPEAIFKLVNLLATALDADNDQYIFTSTRNNLNNTPLSKDILLSRVAYLTGTILGSPVPIQTLRNVHSDLPTSRT